ncbi:MAG: hypothetical protein M1814_001245 [Vezdaea aestivalis]|nr:MAG: hypothetical protein M1814_001245 [Vezdaea aestivalis]
MTATSTPSSSPRPSKRQRDVIIALSVVLGVLFIVFFLFAIFYLRRWYKRRTSITRTGDSRLDAEIEGWRSSKGTTEGANLTGGDRRSSTSQREWDDEKMLQRPPTAKAPNARSGLTDSAVPGADPFVSVRRNSSKLQKRSTSRPGSRPGSMLGHHRSQSSFSITDRPPVSSDRPLTPREPIMESMAEKEAPPLPVDAEETIRNSLGSSKSHRVSS